MGPQAVLRMDRRAGSRSSSPAALRVERAAHRLTLQFGVVPTSPTGVHRNDAASPMHIRFFQLVLRKATGGHERPMNGTPSPVGEEVRRASPSPGPWTLGVAPTGHRRVDAWEEEAVSCRRGPVPLPPDRRRPDRPRTAPFWLEWKEVEVGGRPAAYGEAGAGPPVVFLHGWGLDHRVYKRALARLAAGGVRVLAPGAARLRRHGRPRRRRLDAVGIRVVGGRRSSTPLGITEPAVVVGHSFGGGRGHRARPRPPPSGARASCSSTRSAPRRGPGGAPALRTMAQRPLWDWGLHFPARPVAARPGAAASCP